MTLSQLARRALRLGAGRGLARGREWAITVQSRRRSTASRGRPCRARSSRSWTICARLPAGYQITLEGAAADSGKAEASIAVNLPLAIFIIFTLLMLQLHSFSRALMVFLTGPLGVAGAALALLLLGGRWASWPTSASSRCSA